MARRQGGTLSGFTPLNTPNAPTGLSVSTSIGSATVSFTAPTDTGDGAITSYIVTAVNESTGASSGVTGTESPITISPGGGTFKIRAQAVNGFGPGRLTEFDTGNQIYSGAELYAAGWGSRGELGGGNVESRSSPTQVGALTTWKQAAAGYQFSVALKTDGTMWSFGRNDVGQLGTSNIISRSSPVQIGSLTNWHDVSSRNRSTAALKTDGTLWGWGNNVSGDLGDGTGVTRSSPVQVGSLTDWAKATVGLAVKTDGTLWAWGYNFWGAVGNNSQISVNSPVQIGLLSNWAYVSRTDHSVATKTDGTLWAWGRNYEGQLGTTNIISRSSPVQVGTLNNWAQVYAGYRSTGAVKTDGTLWMWGSNSSGILGNNSAAAANRSSPVQVGALTNWSVVTLMNSAHAIKTDGTLWSWGSGAFGALGDGTTASKSSPVQIGALTNWFRVASGGLHFTALTVV